MQQQQQQAICSFLLQDPFVIMIASITTSTDALTDEKIISMFNLVDHTRIDHLFKIFAMGNICTLNQIKLIAQLGAKIIDISANEINNITDTDIKQYLIDNFINIDELINEPNIDSAVLRSRCVNLINMKHLPFLEFLLLPVIPIVDIIDEYRYQAPDTIIVDFFIKKILMTDINISSMDLNKIMGILMKSDKRPLTLDEIKQFINLGANPRHNDDELFILACKNQSSQIPLFLINECGCDINEQSVNKALGNAMHSNSMQNIQLLLDMNIIINDSALFEAIWYRNEYLSLLITHNANFEECAKKVLSTGFIFEKDQYINALSILVRYGVDFNRVVADMTNK